MSPPVLLNSGEPGLGGVSLGQSSPRVLSPAPHPTQPPPEPAPPRVQLPLMSEPAGRVPAYRAAGFGPICFSSALIYIPGMDQKTK